MCLAASLYFSIEWTLPPGGQIAQLLFAFSKAICFIGFADPLCGQIHSRSAGLRLIQGIQHDKIMYDRLKLHGDHGTPASLSFTA